MEKLNENKWEIFLIALLLYIVLFAAFRAKIETEVNIYELEYNGLVWVALDHWTIQKYNSDDEPMKWISLKTYKKYLQ